MSPAMWRLENRPLGFGGDEIYVRIYGRQHEAIEAAADLLKDYLRSHVEIAIEASRPTLAAETARYVNAAMELERFRYDDGLEWVLDTPTEYVKITRISY